MNNIVSGLAVGGPLLQVGAPGADDAIHAAGELWGPAGVIIAVIVVAVVVYLAYKERQLSEKVDSIQTDFAEQLRDVQEARLAETKEYADKLLQRDRDTVGTLQDVLALLDKLEASDMSLHTAVESARTQVVGKIDDLRQDLKNR